MGSINIHRNPCSQNQVEEENGQGTLLSFHTIHPLLEVVGCLRTQILDPDAPGFESCPLPVLPTRL